MVGLFTAFTSSSGVGMSNLSNALQLKALSSQLPVTAYFDEALLTRELDTLFRKGPPYIGHELMVPEAGGYFALPSGNEAPVRVRNPQSQCHVPSLSCLHAPSAVPHV